jgi:hypothetical protein
MYFCKKTGGGTEVRGFSLFRKGYMLAVFLCAFVLLCSGCEKLTDFADTNSPESPEPEKPVEPDPGPNPDPEPEPDVIDTTVVKPNSTNIKEKFGIDTTGTNKTGTKAVERIFETLDQFLQEDGLTKNPSAIKVGDYIDLEGGLTVQDYNGSGGFTYTGTHTNTRLIVVGIDSFRTGKGFSKTYTYQGEGETPPPHIVFQFKDIPVKRRMNPTATNNGGYMESEMRKYLNGDGAATGNFLAGLIAAGVPEKVLWAPARAIVNVQDGKPLGILKENDLVAIPAIIRDTLWLPTECEMRSDGGPGLTYELQENQAWFEYYTDDLLEKAGGTPYWLASATSTPGYTTTAFRVSIPVKGALNFGNGAASLEGGGVAPAFCIK